jgi:hypothetical protein
MPTIVCHFRTYPQFGAGTALQQYQLPPPQDNLRGFEELPGSGGESATVMLTQNDMCCAVLCCAVLCCAVLCCAVSCHTMQCLAMSLVTAFAYLHQRDASFQRPLPVRNRLKVRHL